MVGRMRCNAKILVPSLSLVLIAMALVIFNLGEVQQSVDYAYGAISDNMSWLFILSNLAALGFAIWAIFGRAAKVRFGGEKAIPDFSTFSWLAIMFTTSCSAGLILFGFLEPLYYVSSPPFQIVPFTEEAYEVAEAYAHYHWGLNAWSLYVPASIAISYLVYNAKSKRASMSGACGLRKSGALSAAVDTVSVLGVVIAPVTSMGLGMPLLVLLVQRVFSLPAESTGAVQIGVFAVWAALFGASVFLGLRKGIKRLSDTNVVIAFAFMAAIGIAAGLFAVLKDEINTLGLYATDFVRMATYTDPYGTGEFVSKWTVWYWAWLIVYMPLMGVMTARVSKGRTVRQVALGLVVCCSAGCWVAMATLGNYSLGVQQSGAVDLCSVLNDSGQAQAILAILETMPFPKLAMIVLAILCFIFRATTVDSSSYVAAEMTAVEGEEAPRSLRLLWAGVACLLTAVLLAVGGFSAVQTLALLAGLPLAVLMFFIIRRCLKVLRTEVGSRNVGTVLDGQREIK